MRKTLVVVFLCSVSLGSVAFGEGTHGAPAAGAPSHNTGSRPYMDGPQAPRTVEMSLFDNDQESTEGLQERILRNLERMNGENHCPPDPSAAYEPCTGTKPVGEFGKDEDTSAL